MDMGVVCVDLEHASVISLETLNLQMTSIGSVRESSCWGLLGIKYLVRRLIESYNRPIYQTLENDRDLVYVH